MPCLRLSFRDKGMLRALSPVGMQLEQATVVKKGWSLPRAPFSSRCASLCYIKHPHPYPPGLRHGPAVLSRTRKGKAYTQIYLSLVSTALLTSGAYPCPRTHILSNTHTRIALTLGPDPLLASEALSTRHMQGWAKDIWGLVL